MPVLVGALRLKLRDKWPQTFDQTVKVRHRHKLGPVAAKEDHQIGALLKVGLGHLVPSQHHDRFDSALDHRKRGILDAKDHWNDRPHPAGEQV